MYKIDARILIISVITFMSVVLIILGSVHNNLTARISGIFLLVVAIIITTFDIHSINTRE